MTDQIERFISDLQRAAEDNRQLFVGTVKDTAGGTAKPKLEMI